MIDALRRLYRRFAGEDAFLGHIPLRALRMFGGDFKTVRVDGRLLTVNLNDDVIAFYLVFRRMWEPNETALMKRVVAPGDRALDVGANIGYYSTLLGSLVGPHGAVLAVEANPQNAALCRRNVDQNGLAGIVNVRECAAGASPGTAQLHISANNLGAHTLVAPNKGGSQTIDVEVVTGDSLVADWDRLDFIKIDVEGYEPLVFAGLRETLARFRDVKVLCEFDPSYIARATHDPYVFLAEIQALGFDFFEVLPEGRTRRTTIDALRAELEGTANAKNLFMQRAAAVC